MNNINEQTNRQPSPRRKRNPLPADLPPEDVLVLYSGAEQQPWDLSPLRMQKAALQTGDYKLLGNDEIRIERKSLSDMVACCGVERDRFERELERIKAFPLRVLVVEADWPDIELAEWRSKITSPAVEASLLSWLGQGISVVMAGSRERAQRLAARLLYVTARRHYRQLRAMVGAMQQAPQEASK